MRLSRNLILGLLLLFGLAATPLVRPLWAGVQEEEEHGEEGPLGMAMETIQGGMRSLGRSLRSPEGAPAALEAVRMMESGLVAALACEAEFPEEMTDATEQQLYRVAFLRKLSMTLDSALQLEEALLMGDSEKAMEFFGALRLHKDEGHEKFQPEEEDH